MFSLKTDELKKDDNLRHSTDVIFILSADISTEICKIFCIVKVLKTTKRCSGLNIIKILQALHDSNLYQLCLIIRVCLS